MRRRLIAGNWKMHLTVSEGLALVEQLLGRSAAFEAADLAVCPSFVALAAICGRAAGTPLRVGAQTMHPEPKGAFTGEVSAEMLTAVGCQHVIVGHSERRTLFGETDDDVNRRVRVALEHGLQPILCVGESLAQRDAGEAESTVTAQLDAGLRVVAPEQMAHVTIAYEPIWAIGTGRVATPEQAQQMHAAIRRRLAERTDTGVAEATRILYGGSLKPGNATALLGQPDIDGGLVGGASLEANSFADIALAG